MEKTLECSTKGDKRFSAFYAKVSFYGVVDSIENHFQRSKRFLIDGKIVAYKNPLDAKGKKPIYFEINGRLYPVKYLSSLYRLLWVKYLDNYPDLVSFAKDFDKFTDRFRGKSINCQADVISDYVKYGRSYIIKNNEEFLTLIKSNSDLNIIDGDLLSAEIDIIGHQFNTQGIMGAGIALQIKNKYPIVFEEYNELCNENKHELLGECQLVKTEAVAPSFIANLFGQKSIGFNSVQTNYEALEKSLMELKEFAKNNYLSVGLPYELGCGLAGGDWTVVSGIIRKVFSDYPVILYKYKKK